MFFAKIIKTKTHKKRSKLVIEAWFSKVLQAKIQKFTK